MSFGCEFLNRFLFNSIACIFFSMIWPVRLIQLYFIILKLLLYIAGQLVNTVGSYVH